MTTPRKNVTLPREVYDRLAATGTTQDTFGVVVSRLLDEHEERARIVSWAVELVQDHMYEIYGSFPAGDEREAAMDELIAGIPCSEIRNAANEFREQLREVQIAYDDYCRREAAEAKEMREIEKQYLEEERLEAEGKQ